MRRILARELALLILLAMAGATRDAYACSCISGNPLCETFWKTSVVFAGEVLEITRNPPANPPEFLAARRVRFRVDRVWRGNLSGEIEIHTGAGGGDCGFEFERGVQYLVYADSRQGRLSTGICNRTRPLADAQEDLAYFETAVRPGGVGRIFGRAQYQRSSADAPERPAAGYLVTLTGGGHQRRTTTGPDGRYEFRDVPAGTYKVELSLPDTERSYGPGKTELADPRGCASVDFSVAPNGRIAVRVLKAHQEPAAKVLLEFIEVDTLSARGRFPNVRYAETDADGSAEIGGLEPNRYVVGVNVTRAPEVKQPYPNLFYPGASDVADARILDLNYGERVELEPWTLPAPLVEQPITGVALLPDGSPAAGAYVSLRSGRGTRAIGPQVGRAFQVDAQGRFSIPAHRDQTYYIRAWLDRRDSAAQWIAETAEFTLTSDFQPLTIRLSPPQRQ